MIKKIYLNFKKPKIKLPSAVSGKVTTLFQTRIDTVTKSLYMVSFLTFLASTIYLAFYYNHLANEIPLWTYLPWGILRVSVKNYLVIIPIINLGIIVSGFYFSRFYSAFNIKEVAQFIGWVILLSTVVLAYSLVDIVNKSRVTYFSFGIWFYDLLIPGITAFLFSFVAARLVLIYADKLKVIEYPQLRHEPAQLLTKPTPRGGALAFYFAFATTTLIFAGTAQKAVGLVIGTFITTLVGYLDDRFKLSYLPRLLLFLPTAIIVVIISGFVMLYIPNPFGEVIKLDTLRFSFELFGQRSIIVYAAVVAFIWFMWITNMVSWNNGVDGQFVAITSITAFVVGILSLRFENISYESLLSAKLSFITLGAILGLFYYTFPPQKMMWGFGATGVGLILGALALLSGTRVSTALIVLLIPSLDTVYVIVSRLLNKKSPFKGDRNHLHHKLLDLGWSKKRIALFYWVISILCGATALLISGRTKALALLTVSGLVLYGLIVLRKYTTRYLVKQSS